VLIVAFVLLSACEWTSPDSDVGSVIIQLDVSDRALPQSFLPDIDTAVQTYVIYGSNQLNGQVVSQTFDIADIVANTAEIGSLTPGSWMFTIEAYSTDVTMVTPLFQGLLSDVYVVADQTVVKAVTLLPLTGDGSLVIEFVFPTILTPSVVADLTPLDVSTPDRPILSDDGTAGIFDYTVPGIARYTGQLESGYYELETILQDGAATLWHNFDALRIVYGYETTATIDVGTGTIDIVIDIDREDPIVVALSSDVSTPNTLDTISFTAAPVGGTAPYTYSWYVNGALQGSAIDVLTLSSLAAGHYRVSVVVSDGTVLGSAFMAVDVVTAP
jgi:hypothetical protein